MKHEVAGFSDDTIGSFGSKMKVKMVGEKTEKDRWAGGKSESEKCMYNISEIIL